MQEVFSRIIEELEIERTTANNTFVKYEMNVDLGRVFGLEKAIEIVKQEAEKCRNGWIPCSERLPRENSSVIVCFAHGTVTELAFYGGLFHGIYDYNTNVIIAWQPLPYPYHPKFIQECANPVSQEEREELNKNIRTIPIGTYQTNADRIRSMSDEELAEFLADSEKFSPCNNCDFHFVDAMNDDCKAPDGWICTKGYAAALIQKWLQ